MRTHSSWWFSNIDKPREEGENDGEPCNKSQKLAAVLSLVFPTVSGFDYVRPPPSSEKIQAPQYALKSVMNTNIYPGAHSANVSKLNADHLKAFRASARAMSILEHSSALE